jgi:hypothetical protein
MHGPRGCSILHACWDGYSNLNGYSVTNSDGPRRPHFHDTCTRTITVDSADPEAPSPTKHTEAAVEARNNLVSYALNVIWCIFGSELVEQVFRPSDLRALRAGVLVNH